LQKAWIACRSGPFFEMTSGGDANYGAPAHLFGIEQGTARSTI
jgi:hypothetical protein